MKIHVAQCNVPELLKSHTLWVNIFHLIGAVPLQITQETGFFCVGKLSDGANFLAFYPDFKTSFCPLYLREIWFDKFSHPPCSESTFCVSLRRHGDNCKHHDSARITQRRTIRFTAGYTLSPSMFGPKTYRKIDKLILHGWTWRAQRRTDICFCWIGCCFRARCKLGKVVLASNSVLPKNISSPALFYLPDAWHSERWFFPCVVLCSDSLNLLQFASTLHFFL